MKSHSKIFFPNLDALRFIAFFAVFMAHAWHVTLPGMELNSFTLFVRHWSQAGVLGVNFFFVLSGFLITFLLLKENETEGKFSIGKFYLRRILRIWPLYFGIVIISYFLFPIIYLWLNKPFHEITPAFYFFTFTSNFAMIKGLVPYSPLLALLWSIAIEEQFYIFWPWLLKLLKNYLPQLFILLIIICVSSRIYFLKDQHSLYYHTLSVISDFAMGGIVAFSFIRKNKLYDFISGFSKRNLVFAWFIIATAFCFYEKIFHHPVMIVLERPLLGACFAFIIAEQCFSQNRIFNAGKFLLFNWLGKISYGLYCFHAIGLIVAKDLMLHNHFLFHPRQFMILFPLLSLLITIAIASFSFYFYEKYFLHWKEKISFVK